MNNLISVFIILFSITTSTCYQENKIVLYGDWQLKGKRLDSDFHLRITEDNKVLFKQEIFKNPCIYDFEGNLKSDTIFYTTKLTCENLKTKIQEHKWTQIDTILVLKKSKSSLKIMNTTNQEIREYIKKNQ